MTEIKKLRNGGILTTVLLGLLTSSVVSASEEFKRFDQMSPDFGGTPPTIFVDGIGKSARGEICALYSNAASLGYRDDLLPDPNKMAIACGPDGKRFKLIESFEGAGAQKNAEHFRTSLTNR